MAGNAKCPICGGARETRFRPFCSRRCADLDLGRWFSGTYAVPVVEEPDGFEDTEIPREAANDDDEFL